MVVIRVGRPYRCAGGAGACPGGAHRLCPVGQSVRIGSLRMGRKAILRKLCVVQVRAVKGCGLCWRLQTRPSPSRYDQRPVPLTIEDDRTRIGIPRPLLRRNRPCVDRHSRQGCRVNCRRPGRLCRRAPCACDTRGHDEHGRQHRQRNTHRLPPPYRTNSLHRQLFFLHNPVDSTIYDVYSQSLGWLCPHDMALVK
jgi:hypothetical protein